MSVEQNPTVQANGRSRPSVGAFLSGGFRPFFLGAAIYGAVSMTLWLIWIGIHAAGGALTFITIAIPPHEWHAHEMIFGFAIAGVAGFLLTAIPNWTGCRPMAGNALAALFLLWVAGRVAMSVSAFVPSTAVTLIDTAFLPVLAVVAARQLLTKPQPRNLVFLILLGAAATANVLFHLAQADIVDVNAIVAVRAGLMVLVVLIVIIGGRVIPAFTTNHLNRIGHRGSMPVRNPRLDLASIITVVLFALCTAFDLGDTVVGLTAGAAALANGIRLLGWQGLQTLRTPIVGVLHVGYAWLVVGLFLWAVNALSGWMSAGAAVHALSTGAVATMILAIMSRASLGHTGRPLVAARPIVVSYALVSCAALVRIFGPEFFPGATLELLALSSVTLLGAFILFAAFHLPILVGPRAYNA